MPISKILQQGIDTSGLTGSNITDGTIAAADLASNAVTTAKIANDAVTADKLANAINTSIAAKLPLAGGIVTGTLGIGSTGNAVDEMLHLEKSSGTTLVKTEVGGNSTVGFEIKKTGATTSNWRIVDGQTVNGKLEIYDVTDSRSVMAFDGDGKVGIGITSLSEKFTVVNSSSGIVGRFTNNTNQTLDLGVISGSGVAGGVYYNNANSGYHAFQSGGTEIARLMPASGGFSAALLVGPTAVQGQGHSLTYGSGYPQYNIVAGVTSSLQVVQFRNPNGKIGTIVMNGSNTAYNTSSDYRLKENVDYTWDATTRLKQLKPARFNFIADDTNTLVDGFLAHEVQSVVPEAITGTKDEVDDNGDAVMQGIDQSKIVPLLVKTIQELEARITALEDA
jgi:hypothetical protein